MPLDLLPWMGLASQMAGAAALFFSGGFGFGPATRRACARGNDRVPSSLGVTLGLALFGAGCVSLAVFAIFERHFLLTGAQCLAVILVYAGVARKAKERRSGS